MKAVMWCRRTFIAMLGVGALTVLGAAKNQDVSLAIATVCVGLAGANAYERSNQANATARYKEGD